MSVVSELTFSWPTPNFSGPSLKIKMRMKGTTKTRSVNRRTHKGVDIFNPFCDRHGAPKNTNKTPNFFSVQIHFLEIFRMCNMFTLNNFTVHVGPVCFFTKFYNQLSYRGWVINGDGPRSVPFPLFSTSLEGPNIDTRTGKGGWRR